MSAFRDAPDILLHLGLLFGFMGIYIIFYYIELYALEESSVSATLASYLLVIINGSTLVGRIISGFYADKLGSINVQTIAASVSGLLTFCLIAIKNSPGLVAYSVLYGFFAGAFMGLPPASVARLTKDQSKIGTRLGMTLAFVGIGMLVSNPIAGAILKRGGGWVGLIVWCGSLLAGSSASMAASRTVEAGFKLARVV
jgi:MFS family permease